MPKFIIYAERYDIVHLKATIEAEDSAKARQIAENGRRFAQRYLSRSGCDLYITTLLKEYARLQRFERREVLRPHYSWTARKTRWKAQLGFLRREFLGHAS